MVVMPEPPGCTGDAPERQILRWHRQTQCPAGAQQQHTVAENPLRIRKAGESVCSLDDAELVEMVARQRKPQTGHIVAQLQKSVDRVGLPVEDVVEELVAYFHVEDR